jgi:amino acid adenylation domain-containing protein
MVGLLINTLPLRVRLQDKEPLLGWLKKIQSDQFELLSHEHTPLVQIQGWSEIPAGRPLFESILIFENYPMGRQLGERFERLKITDVKAWDKTNYPINLAVSPGSPISLEVVYDRRRFEAASITRLLGHLATLLEAMPADPDRRLGDLPLLSALEQRRLSQEWGGADGGKSRTASRKASSPPSAPTIQALVKEQAARDGNRTAVAYEHRNLTYRELDWLSDALAARLEQMGVGGGFLVAVCMERSPEAIVGMLGVLKAGAAYLPLDPAYPKERIQFMLEDSGAAVILIQKPLLGKVPGRGVPVLCLDEPKGFAPNEDAKRSEPRPAREKDPLAYVMYTSGSTGRPKGIQVTHRGLVRLLRNADPIRYAADDVVLQAVSHSFDPSALEIWGCLANGGRLVLLPSRTPTLEEIGEVLVEHRATSLILITGLFPLMVEERLGDLKGLRQLIVGGDVMPPAAARRLLQAFPGIRLINAYGPTEGTIVACSHLMTDPSEIMHTIPIGRPAAETRVHLLDRAMRQVPAGIPGELFIGGEGVARGYHRRPDLTAERFVPDPFDDGPGARLYRTGDLARWRSDGKLEFLGRVDQQVKIRGYRIEPGEVETVLGLHPDVRECAVVPQAGIAGERRLVAYVVSSGRGALSTGDLRDFLKGKLPEFMLPAAFVMVERLSLTPNGKVDRAALPPPESAGWKARSERVPPRTPCETEVASIWAEVLEKESPGVEDDFFEAGGHSLLATKLISRLRGRFGPLVSLRDLYDTPTIRGLATLLETMVPEGKEDESHSGEGKTPRRGDGVVPPGTDTGPLRPMVGRGEAP